MKRAVTTALAAAALWAASWSQGTRASEAWGPRDLARRLEVEVTPRHAWRYFQGAEPRGGSTLPLLEGRRAFFPGESLVIGFKLPRDARLEAPVRLEVALSLHDLDGTPLGDALDGSIEATPAGVTGSIPCRVPDLAEGRYLVAARFADAAGGHLVTRSQVVWLTPEYPRLLAAAEEAVSRAREASDALPPLLREVSLPSVEMLVEDARMRWHDFGHAPRDWEFVKSRLETARTYAERVQSGEDPYKDRTGLFVKAYRSSLDDTLQPYALYVPPTYDARKAYPLVVSLHGATSNHLLNIRRVFGFNNRPGESDYEAVRNELELPAVDFVVVSPYGRGEVAGYNGIGEQDVLQVMEDVERAYNVDRDRVHLTGLSMGGGGTWHLGLRYPDRFASLTPVCAVGDLAHRGDPDRLNPLDRELMDLTGPSVLAENALNQHVFVFHGDEDDTVPVSQSRRLVERFRSLGWLGRTARYFELPGVNHLAWDLAYRDASLFPRLAPLRRDPFPRRVVYRTFSLRYNRAYWLRIDRIDYGTRLAAIEASRGEQGFEVRTENLSAFSILLSPEIAPPGRRIEVQVDGRRAFRGVPAGDDLSLARRPGGEWEARPWVGPPVGPPDHAEASFFPRVLAHHGPHVYVYGTGGDAAANAATRAFAEKLADWGPWVRARFRVVSDEDVTPELAAAHSLVLVGDARVNRVVGRIQARLPLRQDGTGTFAGGQRVAGPGASFRLHQPSPLAPGRWVLIYAAADAGGLERLETRRGTPGPSGLADYVVVEEDGTVALEGFFRDGWRIDRLAAAARRAAEPAG